MQGPWFHPWHKQTKIDEIGIPLASLVRGKRGILPNIHKNFLCIGHFNDEFEILNNYKLSL
jgi:hypothetical protein